MPSPKPAARIFPLTGRRPPTEAEPADTADDEAPRAKVVRPRKRKAPFTTEAQTA